MRLVVCLLLLCCATAASTQQLYRWKDDNGIVQYTDSPPAGRPYETRAVLPEPPRPAADPTPAATPPATPTLTRCEQAERNLRVFEAGGAVSMDLDGDGEPEALDTIAREREFNRARELVRLECEEAAGR